MMWPWSFDVCDRTLQPAQEISACAKTRHWDLRSGQGRCVAWRAVPGLAWAVLFDREGNGRGRKCRLIVKHA